MAHLFLPISDIESVTIPQEGHWASQDEKIIRNIANAIGEKNPPREKAVSSVPDIWARAIVFQSAIGVNSRHPMKERITKEWKGLLSLLALSKYKKYDLKIIPIKLDENEKFVKALINLAPKGISLEQGQEYKWIDPELKEPILLITYKNIPVGSFSPTTLVYTGIDYAKKLLKNAPELSDFLIDKDGYLTPPENKSDIEETEFLGEWISKLIGKLKAAYNKNDQRARKITENLTEVLNSWLSEIRERLGKPSDTKDIDSERVKVSDKIPEEVLTGNAGDFFKDSKHNFYRFLLCPLVEDENYQKDETHSQITLSPKRNHSNYNEIVVITENLLRSGKKIWDIKKLGDLGGNSSLAIKNYFREASGTKIDDLSMDKNGKTGMWVRPELYFLTDSILKAKQGEFFNDNENVLKLNSGAYVWPFRKEILDFFSPWEIKDTLKPKIEERNDSVKFSFKLPVAGEEISIEKSYKIRPESGEHGVIEVDVPVIEIFPKYLGKDWRRYYLFQSHTDKFIAEPVKINKEIEVEKAIEDSTKKIKTTVISGDDCFPEGLEILHKSNPIGLILLNKDNNRNETLVNETWTIGVDFGTSNTNIARKSNKEDNTHPWSFNFPELVLSISNSDKNLREKMFKENFIPTDKKEFPITTTMKRFNTDKNPVLIDSSIYFPEIRNYKFPDEVISDIKWDDGETMNTKFFLKNLLFLILSEVVNKKIGKIKFVYSYPKAFSSDALDKYGSAWKEVYNELLIKENRVLNIASAGTKEKINISEPTEKSRETEGKSAGEFFANTLDIDERGYLKNGSVCLDVGGGTTDISIWWNNEIRKDFSIMLAGKQISKIFEKSANLKAALFSPEAVKAMEGKTGAKFTEILNYVLKVEQEEIISRITNQATELIVKRLKQLIAIEFGALSYYAAMACYSYGKLQQQDKSLLSTIEEGGIGLYWGGNASKLISWIDNGHYGKDGVGVYLLNALFYNCLKHAPSGENVIKLDQTKLKQIPSRFPKSEASGGLVTINWEEKNLNQNDSISHNDDMDVDLNDNNQTISKENPIVIGENVKIKGNEIPFYKEVSNNDFYKDTQTLLEIESINSLEKLKQFITIFNVIGKKKGLFSEETQIDLSDAEYQLIINNVRQEFLRNSTLKTKRILEPVFILEVKALMEVLINKWIRN